MTTMETPSLEADPPVVARILDLRALAARKSHFV
jgi:hypothetical protein